MLKIGVAGAGHMGRYHINILPTVSGIEFSSICDIDQDLVKNLSREYNVRGYTEYDKFLSSVDAVIIAVPTFLHYRFASKALESGKHVLLEKPMTKTVYFAEKIIKLADSKNLVLQVGHVERFNAAVQELKNIVDRPFLIQAQRMGPKSRIKDIGVVLDLMIHDIDIVLSLAGSKPVSISAYGRKIYTGFEDIASATIYFENGVIAIITASRVSANKSRTLSISQEGSYIHLDYATQDITVIRQPLTDYVVLKEELKYRQESLVEHVAVYKENALKLEQIHFIECIKDGKEPIRDADADISTLKIAKEITDKIYSGWKR